MRYRITVKGDGMELRGFFDTPTPGSVGEAHEKLQDFAKAMTPYGYVVASVVSADYNPFTEDQ